MSLPSEFADLGRQDPRNPWPHVVEGKDYARKGKHQPAIFAFDEALRRIPLPKEGRDAPNFQAYFETHLERGLSYFKLAKYRQAIADLDMVADARQKVDVFYRNNPEFETSKEHILTALKPMIVDALFYRSLCFARTKKHPQARSDLDMVLQHKPSFVDAYVERGQVLAQQGELALALKDFTQAIQHDPRNFLAYYQRALVHVKLGELAKEKEDLRKAREIDPKRFAAMTS